MIIGKVDDTLDYKWHFRGTVDGNDFGGYVESNCPVESFGRLLRVDGSVICWFFRARWSGWRLYVGPESMLIGEFVSDDEAVWYADGGWGDFAEAGWMPYDVAVKIIDEALTRYLRGEAVWYAPDDLHREPA